MRRPAHHPGIVGWLGLSLAGAALLSSPARAQDPDAVQHRNECRLAIQVLTHGQPANKRDWALDQVTTCGAAGGQTLARELTRLRAARGNTREFERVVAALAGLQDGAIFRSALSLAADGSAGSAARVNAIRTIFHQLVPSSFVEYDQVVRPEGDDSPALLPAFSSEGVPIGAPLPADRSQLAEATLRQVGEDERSPPEVRAAARWVLPLAALRAAKERLCTPAMSADACTAAVDAWLEERP